MARLHEHFERQRCSRLSGWRPRQNPARGLSRPRSRPRSRDNSCTRLRQGRRPAEALSDGQSAPRLASVQPHEQQHRERCRQTAIQNLQAKVETAPFSASSGAQDSYLTAPAGPEAVDRVGIAAILFRKRREQPRAGPRRDRGRTGARGLHSEQTRSMSRSTRASLRARSSWIDAERGGQHLRQFVGGTRPLTDRALPDRRRTSAIRSAIRAEIGVNPSRAFPSSSRRAPPANRRRRRSMRLNGGIGRFLNGSWHGSLG